MRKKTLFLLAFCIWASSAQAQEVAYQPTKESILQHGTPTWFQKAKVGVFIHFTPDYKNQREPDHFSADEWIDLFNKAGAEYFVYTTKHNNGWSNWPSKLSEHSAKQKNGPWDMVSPLVESARNAGMKVGLYYNLMNRFEGVGTDMVLDPEREPSEDYVLNSLHPQIKELVSTYRPDIFWTDGDWISTSEYWHSNEIVAWLYNWAEINGREICLTDRWGRDIRICTTKETPEKYGDFWTLERRIMKDVVCAHPWESCVTLTESWHYKENEEFRVADNELIGIMCDIVSKGGRFLINIGPAPDGSIRESDKETLLAVGNWLRVNGEAIYGTKPMDCMTEKQSANAFDRAKDLLLPQSGINDFPGVWDQMQEWNQNQGPIRFTKNNSFVYAIHQGWPGKKLELRNISILPGSKIRMLGVQKTLSWKAEEDKIIIKLPSKKPCEHAFVLKLEVENHKL